MQQLLLETMLPSILEKADQQLEDMDQSHDVDMFCADNAEELAAPFKQAPEPSRERSATASPVNIQNRLQLLILGQTSTPSSPQSPNLISEQDTSLFSLQSANSPTSIGKQRARQHSGSHSRPAPYRSRHNSSSTHDTQE